MEVHDVHGISPKVTEHAHQVRADIELCHRQGPSQADDVHRPVMLFRSWCPREVAIEDVAPALVEMIDADHAHARAGLDLCACQQAYMGLDATPVRWIELAEVTHADRPGRARDPTRAGEHLERRRQGTAISESAPGGVGHVQSIG